ncbi:alpha/beta fold hydrolase [Oceanicola sp. 502str15]|uniref:alpha/beta fold hydrolase n=1 Tax=Oceanicola sp. 502str15 TaxID=2696061 RepID=UPI0020947724|nr:alpha/beta hydrolase [Oceanicola sp. 502str15]MCO6381507.1 alpha/beta fold hydrolase [Oceanicola sp. 502str15]
MTRRIEVPGGWLAVEDQGAGAPVVFLHGFSLDHRSWEPQMNAFRARHRCIAYDLRGFGQSSLPQGDYDHVADLEALRAALGLDRFSLVGLSLGANVARAYAASHPERVAGLVLASSGLAGHDWGGAPRPPEEALQVAQAQGPEAARAFWLAHPLFASLADAPEARASVHRQVADYALWHWRAPGRAARIADAGALADLSVPTLVISGDRDLQGYRDIAATLAREIPTARLTRIAGAGHMVNLEAPETFNTALAQFLATHGTPEEETQP